MIFPAGFRPIWPAPGTRSTPATTTRALGRILMGPGRDAADVALTTSFGLMDLAKFVVISDEVVVA